MFQSTYHFAPILLWQNITITLGLYLGFENWSFGGRLWWICTKKSWNLWAFMPPIWAEWCTTSFPEYLSEGPLSYCCSAIAPGSPVVVVFIYKDEFTDHTYACIENLIGVCKTALNHIWAVSIKWRSGQFNINKYTIKYPSYCAVMYLRISAWKRPSKFTVDSS